IIDVPSPASRSIRRLTVSSGTGSEVLSYSLQYLQDRLQRRIGTRCARIGCFVENSPRDINLASRRSVETFFINKERRQDEQDFPGCSRWPGINPSSAILENPINPVYDELFLLLNLFFLFDSMACPFFLPRFVNLPGHRFAGEMSRPAAADDHELFGGVEGLLDAEIFLFARNLRLSFNINQALPRGLGIAEPDFDPAINRIFSQFKKGHFLSVMGVISDCLCPNS